MAELILWESLGRIVHSDLRFEAERAVLEGAPVERHIRTNSVVPLVVETVVIGDRAGQASGGNATWGDWDAAAEVLRPDGEGIALDLDGNEVAP